MFKNREQLPIPLGAQEILNGIPDRFVDDGCSNSPDSLWGWRFKWACRIHDWRYCTRCHHPRETVYEFKKAADKELRVNISSCLPLRWKLAAYVYKFFVWRYGCYNAWDSCGVDVGTLCRHNILIPDWMK